MTETRMKLPAGPEGQRMRDSLVAPQTRLDMTQAYLGMTSKKPWEYLVTMAIPHLGTPAPLALVVELYRLQTVRPFIMIIDTGSREAELERVRALRAEDVEVHEIAMVATPHPSDFPAVAMDLALALCRTEYLFGTHSDCLPRRRDLVEWYLQRCSERQPVVGYEMSPRNNPGYKGMVSHTATMYHMPTMDRVGFGFCQRRLLNKYGTPHAGDGRCNSWPDTEVLGNMILREHGIPPLLVGGPETNYERWVDDNIDHVRTLTAGKLYSPDYYNRVITRYEAAMREGHERLERWRKEANAE